MGRLQHILWIIAGGMLLGFPGPAAASGPEREPLPVYYFNKPPYYIEKPDGAAGGFLVEVARLILDGAGIPHRFERLPVKRILRAVQSGERCASVGWFRTPERERYALFSLPIYQNRPIGLVVARDTAQRLPPRPSLQKVLAAGLSFGAIEGFSYGPWLDEHLAALGPRLHRVTGEPEDVYRMILKGRFEATFVAPEEAFYLMSTHGAYRQGLRFLPLKDAPEGNPRHLMFGAGLEPGLLDAVNLSIRKATAGEDYRRILRQIPTPP